MNSIDLKQQDLEHQALVAISSRNPDLLAELIGGQTKVTYKMLEAALRLRDDKSNILGMLIEGDDLEDPVKNSKYVAQVIRNGQPGKFKIMLASDFNFWGFDFDETNPDQKIKEANYEVNRAFMTAITKAKDGWNGAPYRDIIQIAYDYGLFKPGETMGGIEDYAGQFGEVPGYSELGQMLKQMMKK